MKILALLLFAFVVPGPLLAAQSAPASTAELKAKLAEAQQQIAEQKKQIIDLEIRIAIAERLLLPEASQARESMNSEAQAARAVATQARATADAESAKSKKVNSDDSRAR